MSKKTEVRCDSMTYGDYDWQCVLRDGHIGQCLAWWSDDESIRWSKPKPKPCEREVLVNVGYNLFPWLDGSAAYLCSCELDAGHDGACVVKP